LLQPSLVTRLKGIFNEAVFVAAFIIVLSAGSGSAADVVAPPYTKAPAMAEVYD
jgi:hypothetical protein